MPPLRTQPRYPGVDSPFFDATSIDDPGARDRAQQFHDDGALLMPGMLGAADLDAARAETAPLFGDDPDGPRSTYRCQDAWLDSPATRRIATAPAVLELIHELYGRRPFPFQTLTFRTGSQQRAHADTLHFNSIPARFMCAAWVALEDIGPTSGPLFYHPGSHRLPELRSLEIGSHPVEVDYPAYEDAIEAAMNRNAIPATVIEAKKGDMFLWSANLAHGGNPVTDPNATRWSQVTHYYFPGCVYYAPRDSDPLRGTLALRDVTDVGTGERVEHRIGEHAVKVEPVDDIRSQVRCDAWYPPSGARRELTQLGRQARRTIGAAGEAIGRRLRR